MDHQTCSFHCVVPEPSVHIVQCLHTLGFCQSASTEIPGPKHRLPSASQNNKLRDVQLSLRVLQQQLQTKNPGCKELSFPFPTIFNTGLGLEHITLIPLSFTIHPTCKQRTHRPCGIYQVQRPIQIFQRLFRYYHFCSTIKIMKFLFQAFD